MKLSINRRNWLLSLHIATGGLWFGAAVCSVCLGLSVRLLPSSDALYGINLARNVMGQYIIAPAAILAVITGAFLCCFTHWGFFRYSWIVAKQIVTLILIILGSIWLGPLTEKMTALSQIARSQVLQNSTYLELHHTVILGGALQCLALFLIITLSIFKPWGKRKTALFSKK